MKEFAGRTLMLVENSFPYDLRVKNEAAILTDAGYKVTVVALRRNGEKAFEEINGVRVYRIPRVTLFNKIHKNNDSLIKKLFVLPQSFIGYVSEYAYFTSACFFMSLYILVKEGFDVIHAHNPPDTLFLIGAFYKLFGKKFVFDHHDLSPELYLSRYKLDGGLVYRVLSVVEKCSLKLSDVVIATNESYKEIDVNRGKVDPRNVFVVRNGPDLKRVQLMPPDEKLREKGKHILGYVGVMNPQDGVDYLLRALHYLIYELKKTDFYCVIIGSGDSLEDLKSMAAELTIEDKVWFTGYIPDNDVIRYLSTADICLDPDPSSPLNNVSTWIKIMEYMALGKPIVSFNLKETRYSARDAALFVTPNDTAEFAKAIVKLMDNPDLRRKMGEFGRERIEKELVWDIVGQNLVRAYGRLIN